MSVVWPEFKPRDPLLHAKKVPIINGPGRLIADNLIKLSVNKTNGPVC